MSSDQNNCKHLNKVSNKLYENCKDCGVIVTKDSSEVYKSRSLNFECLMDTQKLIRSLLKKRTKQILNINNSSYLQKRQSLIDVIQMGATKLQITEKTQHLAIYFMDIVMSQITVHRNDYELYANTCLFIAAKAVELDEKIPFISKLKKYTLSTNSSEDFKICEQQILKQLNWDLQLVTNYEMTQFMVANGILFSDDETDSSDDMQKENKMNILENLFKKLQFDKKPLILQSLSQKQIDNMLQKQEEYFSKLQDLIIRDARFSFMDLKLLSAASVAVLRKLAGLKNIWNNRLTEVYQISESEISHLVGEMIQKFQKQILSNQSEENNKVIANNLNRQNAPSKYNDFQNNLIYQPQRLGGNYN